MLFFACKFVYMFVCMFASLYVCTIVCMHLYTVNPYSSPLGLIYFDAFWVGAYSRGGLIQGGAYKII